MQRIFVQEVCARASFAISYIKKSRTVPPLKVSLRFIREKIVPYVIVV